MTKNLLWMALVATTLSVGFTSCGDDDADDSSAQNNTENNAQQPDNDNSGEGTVTYRNEYTAWGSVLFAYIQTPMLDDNETLVVTQDSIFFHSDTWGDGKFEKATNSGKLTMSNHGRTGEYEATIETVSESVYKITVPSVMGGTVITVTLGQMPLNNVVAGTYTGGIYANMSYAQKFQPTADQSISIATTEGQETVSVTFNNSTWGTFFFPAVTVQKNDDGSYTLSGEGSVAMPNRHATDGSTVSTYDAVFSGTITNGNLVADLSVPSVMGGTTILFNPADFDEVLNSSSQRQQ